jgi:hypothetical protein
LPDERLSLTKDATNIARIVIELARRNVLLEPNAQLPPPAGAKRFSWMGEKPGEVIWHTKRTT